jgi:YfiH family protein
VFSFQEARGAVEVAFTDRHGGVSGGPYASLNLAEPQDSVAVGERRAVAENLDLVARALARGVTSDGGPAVTGDSGVPTVVRMHQVHGADVHTVDRRHLASPPERPPVADGLVTDVAGVALLVRVADCVPLLLADTERLVVGAAHAGRPGLVAGVVPSTVARMRELGADRIVAWLGPHVCGRCYEVPAAMREEVAAVVPAAFAETSWGTPAVDVGASVVAQLEAEGVEVVDASRCTLESEDLYSYRRQGAASGRLGGLVWVRA